LKVDRAEYWIARGAQPSDTVRSLLKRNKKPGVSAPVAATPARAEPEPAPVTPPEASASMPEAT